LEGELCQLAANLATGAGLVAHAAELCLEAARRALQEGSLASAEALALRAREERPLESDLVLLSTWALGGQPLRALEVGQRILSSRVDPEWQTEVRLILVDAMVDAGRWDDAEDYLETLRRAPESTPSDSARRAIGEAEVALARNDRNEALRCARAALAQAQAAGLVEVTCRALWLIGRVDRGRDTAAASAAFEEAYEYATRHRLGGLSNPGHARVGDDRHVRDVGDRPAGAGPPGGAGGWGAVDGGDGRSAAGSDLQLPRPGGLTLAAASRCEEVSRRFTLASLPMSLALQGVGHGSPATGRRWRRLRRGPGETEGDRDTVEMITLGNGIALYQLGEGHIREADRGAGCRHGGAACGGWSGPTRLRAAGRWCAPSSMTVGRRPGRSAGSSTSTRP
jgi:tetratricopeptide (TPR) repeat protein